MVERTDFVRADIEESSEWAEVRRLADALTEHLRAPDVLARIAEANQPGRSSAAVQAVFIEQAIALGFQSESVGLFQSYESSALRPDYYRRVGDTGVLLEVERGKTTINNMDLLDFGSALSRCPGYAGADASGCSSRRRNPHRTDAPSRGERILQWRTERRGASGGSSA